MSNPFPPPLLLFMASSTSNRRNATAAGAEQCFLYSTFSPSFTLLFRRWGVINNVRCVERLHLPSDLGSKARKKRKCRDGVRQKQKCRLRGVCLCRRRVNRTGWCVRANERGCRSQLSVSVPSGDNLWTTYASLFSSDKITDKGRRKRSCLQMTSDRFLMRILSKSFYESKL